MGTLSEIGIITIPGQYDEDGNELVAPVAIPGWHIITTEKLVGLDAYLSAEPAGREFAGAVTYHYVFADATEARSLVGWAEDEEGGRFTSVFRDAEPIPSVVSMRQARLALLHAGLLGTVQDTLATMAGDAGEAARIEWEYAQEVKRDWPTLAAIASGIGLTENQIDDLFRVAATL